MNKSQYVEDEDSSSLYQEESKAEKLDIVNISRYDIKEPIEELKKSEPSQFELERIEYLKELEASGEKD